MFEMVREALIFIVAVGPLIIFHELGHYWAARWCGVRSEAFSIGFGPELMAWVDQRGTRWRVAALPLGGYVRFAGAYEPDGAPSKRQPFDGFETARLWERAVIVLAGPVANFILAIALLIAILAIWGQPSLTNVVGKVSPNGAAQAAGIHAGDQITALDNTPTPDFSTLREAVQHRSGATVRLTVMRDGHPITIDATPKVGATLDEFGTKVTRPLLGVEPRLETVYPPLYMTPWLATRDVVQTVGTIFMVIGKIVSGQLSATLLGGPVSSAKVATEAASYGLRSFLSVMAFLSINLGFMNLLPIPVLDGGHLALFGLEAVRKRPLSPRARETAFKTGLAILMTLFLFVTFNDIGAFGALAKLAHLNG